MPLKVDLQIPSQHVETIKSFIRLPAEKFDRILEVLDQQKSLTATTNLVKAISRRSSLPLKDARDVLALIEEIQVVRSNMEETVGREAFMESLMEALVSQQIIPQSLVKAAHSRFVRVLHGKNLNSIQIKARELRSEYERTYLNCRILTDIRPLFEEKPDEQPSAFIVKHVMKITHHRDQMHESLFVAMDVDDLKAMQLTITRALEKEKTIGEMFKLSPAKFGRDDG